MSDTYEAFAIEADGDAATHWLTNPERRNAMGPAFWNELPVAMRALDTDPRVRAIVLAARGAHFTVGLDLKSMVGSLGGGESTSGAATRTRLLDEIIRLQGSITAV